MRNVKFAPSFRKINMTGRQFFCDMTLHLFVLGSVKLETRYCSYLQGSTFEDESNTLEDIDTFSSELVTFRDP